MRKGRKKRNEYRDVFNVMFKAHHMKCPNKNMPREKSIIAFFCTMNISPAVVHLPSFLVVLAFHNDATKLDTLEELGRIKPS